MTIENICREFLITGDYVGYIELKDGIINKSYKVTFLRNGEEKDYVLQRINTNVFENPERIMQNIIDVTEHIRTRIKQTGISAKRLVLHCSTTKNGSGLYYDDEGGCWRCYRFIDNSVVFNFSDNLSVIEEVGRAFGNFQLNLSDYDASKLFESIPHFHDTKMRYVALEKAVSQNLCDRVKEVENELKFLNSVKEKASHLIDLREKGELPLRVTHNDTKCNNVCFDKKTLKALAVLDLDTVMPGLVAYDFGDAVRFIANNSAEDEKDISKTYLDIEKYTALCKGFIGTVGYSLSDIEVETMAQGAFAVTVELAVRFLTDYINGDKYFKTCYEGHNLVRARCQIALAKDMLSKKEQMKEIVKQSI